MIIFILPSGPARFNKIKQLSDGASPNMLAQALRELELNGIVRKTDGGNPGYELTKAGYKISELLIEISKIMDHLP